MVAVSGTAAAVEKAFYLQLNYYKRPDGTQFYGPDREPSVDTTVPLQHIGNLNNLFVSKPAKSEPNGLTQPPSTGSGIANYYIGDDFRYAYAYDNSTKTPTTLTGSGQCVALIAGDGFSLLDINNYWKNSQRSNPLPTIQERYIASTGAQPCKGGAAGDCTSDKNIQCNVTQSQCPSSDPGEMTLDIEMVLAMAPGAEIFTYSGPDTDTLLSGIATDTVQCRQISTSYGIGTDKNTNAALLELAAQGQTFFTGSGDWGATIWGDFAYSPYITAVGATDLVTTAARGPYSFEVPITVSGGFVVNGANATPCGTPDTDVSPIPAFQTNLNTNTNNVSPTYRNVPDVSIVGNDLELDVGGGRGSVWGTSASSPLWAGFMALVNEQNASRNLGPVGYANPVLYAMARTRGSNNDIYTPSFHDIDSPMTLNPPQPTYALGVDVMNCFCDNNGFNCTDTLQVAFPAAPGYDVATGLGTPSLGLINQLASPSPVPPKDVAAGQDHACALRSDGSVWCWGGNEDGQLGNGTTDTGGPCTNDGGCEIPYIPHLPSPVIGLPASPAVAIGASDGGSCAVLSDGTLWCWGGVYGAAGKGTPSQIQGISNATAIAAKGAASCALIGDGTVRCWGSNVTGQLGDGITPTGLSAPTILTPVQVKGITNAIAVRSSGGTTCALLATGGVMCWGDNIAGQLGNGSTTSSNAPVAVSGISNAIDLAVGGLTTCAVLADGTAACWGYNRDGELGNNDQNKANSSVPVSVVGLSNARQIAIATPSTCAVLSDGSVTCWGENLYYDLGDGDLNQNGMESRLSPQPGMEVKAIQGLFSPHAANAQLPFQFISGGNSFYCATLTNGVGCWGHNLAGDLGNDATADSSIPVTVQFVHP